MFLLVVISVFGGWLVGEKRECLRGYFWYVKSSWSLLMWSQSR